MPRHHLALALMGTNRHKADARASYDPGQVAIGIEAGPRGHGVSGVAPQASPCVPGGGSE
ncbi:hypothetical protein CHELA1G11_11461 [Hyphomicrobiales bacterium]|nr:hypothetical protein CHELA1G11_11461 [Hyphomicrobiales bacterium]CAH1667603.1 hypothetical protein CHELA1G2_12848 [Hyphomicrobiales bacterium]